MLAVLSCILSCSICREITLETQISLTIYQRATSASGDSATIKKKAGERDGEVDGYVKGDSCGACCGARVQRFLAPSGWNRVYGTP